MYLLKLQDPSDDPFLDEFSLPQVLSYIFMGFSLECIVG